MAETENPVRSVRWIDPEKTVVVIEASGEIDLHRSAVFQEALLEPLNHRPQRMIVDMTGVSFMDSSGVASLVKLLSRVRRDKVDLRLAGLAPRVRSVFEITRLDTVFDLYPGLQEALDS
ncbi:MAG: STAS domain-containing protein [Planctomycetota bacterium]|nr:STAS domain-containing protein [Planctomycetota bacterium]